MQTTNLALTKLFFFFFLIFVSLKCQWNAITSSKSMQSLILILVGLMKTYWSNLVFVSGESLYYIVVYISVIHDTGMVYENRFSPLIESWWNVGNNVSHAALWHWLKYTDMAKIVITITDQTRVPYLILTTSWRCRMVHSSLKSGVKYLNYYWMDYP